MFQDRSEAGERLADRLEQVGIEADVVLAIPRGGLPVGRAVADRLSAPLDVVVARKLGAPGNPELAIGAVAADGTLWRNDRLIADLGVSDAYLDEEIETQRAAASDKLARYRDEPTHPPLEGRTVVLVDDGIATGATITACARVIEAAGAEQVIVAVPVAPSDAIDRLREEVDRVEVLETPRFFGAVGAFYRDFAQVSDEEAIGYLEVD
ncbi:MAG: phosphoribosyltransferase [Halobacteriales archaeon]